MNAKSRPKTFDRRFKGISWFKLISTTPDCPLTFEEIVVYSYLVRAASRGESYRASSLASDTGFSEGKTIPKCRERLVACGLAHVEAGEISAVEPTASNRDWFYFFEGKSDIWISFRYFRVPVRSDVCPLSSRQVATLGLVYSYAKCQTSVKGLSVKGFATQIGATRQTIHDALVTLSTSGIITYFQAKDDRLRFASNLPVLTEEHRSWFAMSKKEEFQEDSQYPGFCSYVDEEEDDNDDLISVIQNGIVETDEKGMNNQEDEKEDEDEDEEHPLIASLVQAGYSESQAKECVDLGTAARMTDRKFQKVFDSSQKFFDSSRFPSSYFIFAAKLKTLAKYTPKQDTTADDRVHQDAGRQTAGLSGGDDSGHEHSGSSATGNDPATRVALLLQGIGYTESDARTRVSRAGADGHADLGMIEHDIVARGYKTVGAMEDRLNSVFRRHQEKKNKS